MRRFDRFGVGLSCLLALFGCAGPPAPKAAVTGPTAHGSSDASASEKISLTVYNQNFGLVREVRSVHLGTGRVELSYGDVSAHIQPETVHIKSLSGDNALNVLEQNYRYDLLTPETLLKKYVGKKVLVYRYNESTGVDEEKQAELLSTEGGTVVKIDGQVMPNFPGRFAFPEVPENLVQKPTLVWLLSSAAESQRVEVTYQLARDEEGFGDLHLRRAHRGALGDQADLPSARALVLISRKCEMKTKVFAAGLAFVGALTGFGPRVALGDSKPATAPTKPPLAATVATHSVSTADDRKQVSITVYNQNFGLVREVRELPQLGSGTVELEFRDVAANIQPETVHIKSLSAGGGMNVLEQNYRYDLLTPQTLLEKYVGKRVRAYRYHEKTGTEDVVDADLLSVTESPVLKVNGEITFGYQTRLAFPQVPDNLIAKPTLVWLVDSAAPKQTVEVTYLTKNLNWSADYVLVVDDAEKKGDLTGWVTLVNQSGASYKNAALKLVAGDVNRVEPAGALPMIARSKSAVVRGGGGFQEQALFEYHLYALERPTSVLQNEQKQV